MKVSPKFRWIWTSFARDSTFEALFTGCLGATGLTGIDNRSDRSDRGAAPVCRSEAASSVDSLVIASLTSASLPMMFRKEIASP